MIRCYLGAGLLIALLALGIISGKCLTDQRQQLLSQAREALEASTREDWPRAEAAAEEARRLWQRRRAFNAVFSDHAALENVDDALAQVRYSRDPADFSRLCRSLEALAREQAASLENIL